MLILCLSYFITTVSFYNRLVWQGKRGSKLRGSSQLHTVAKFIKFHPKSLKDNFLFDLTCAVKTSEAFQESGTETVQEVVWVNREKTI